MKMFKKIQRFCDGDKMLKSPKVCKAKIRPQSRLYVHMYALIEKALNSIIMELLQNKSSIEETMELHMGFSKVAQTRP